MAASEVAQAEPFFDEKGGLWGKNAEQDGAATKSLPAPRLRLSPKKLYVFGSCFLAGNKVQP